MPFFEFVVPGAFPLPEGGSDAARQKWAVDFRAAAQAAWAGGKPPAHFFVTVAVTCYYHATPGKPEPPNVHAVLQPILEGLQGVAYANANQVFHVTSDRVNTAYPVDAPSPVVEKGLSRFRELLYIWVLWDDEV